MNTNQFKLKLALSKASQSLLDKATASKSVKKLTAKIEATHSGIVNKNKWFYTPTGMKDGTNTFIEPFNKPVLRNHDSEGDSLGRVVASEYISYNDTVEAGLLDTTDSVSYFSKIKDFVKGEIFNAKDYKGLGHIELTVEITDKDAIEKLLDGRFLTVSISGDTEQAVCSVCGQDKKAIKDDDESCEHYRGEVYDGEEAFLIAGLMSFEEVSFVNKPADENAKVQILNDSINLEDNTEFQELTILDFEIENTGDDKLKIKLSDLIKKEDLQGTLNDALKSLGLDDHASSDEELNKLRKTSFLYSDERALPTHSKAAILAVYKVLEDVEDSKDKEDLLTVLDKKFAREFGKISIEDAIALLVKKKEDVKDEKDVDKQVSFDVDYDLISDKVVEKIKSSFDLDDSFLAKRNESLEDEIESLEKENTTLIDSLRSTIILQILQAEERVSDTEYQTKLEGRTLDSLKDKLADLVQLESKDVENEKEGSEEDGLEDNAKEDEKDISDTDVDISDAVEDEGKVEDSDKDSDTDEDLKDNENTLSVEQIRDEYKKLIRTEGMRAASGYLSDLREKNNLPANFTFSR